MTSGGPRWIVYRTDEAEQEYGSLSPKRKGDVKAVLRMLSLGPGSGGSKELEGHPGMFRVHVSKRWRILFTIEAEVRRIRVFRIRPRNRAYEGLERR